MRNIAIILSVIIILLGSVCSESSSPKASDDEILNDGWENFENGDFEEALELFLELVDREASLAEAYCGMGWCLANQGFLDSALQNFTNALIENPDQDLINDIYAGQGFSYEASAMYQNCLLVTGLVDSDWSFEHDQNLSYSDLILLRAICHYGLADFANSLIEVQILDPDFTADISTPEGRAALAAKIEELRGIV